GGRPSCSAGGPGQTFVGMTACKRAAMVLVAALALQSEIVQAFRAAVGVAIAPQSPSVCARRGVWRGADGRHHRAAWGLPRGMCNPNTARSCEALDVDVVSATEQMFGSLAALRVSELEQHFDGMSLREAELLEMQKDFQGETIRATVSQARVRNVSAVCL
ncbi:MAG: hypothetical protein ACPIOQ_69695, partial [Promethearchaeia archaeon]